MMGRRPVLIFAALVILAAGVWLYRAKAGAGGSTIAADGPVILISIDTLRADRLPAYGYKSISTPAIDRLVADSVLFENAYSHSPQTMPSRRVSRVRLSDAATMMARRWPRLNKYSASCCPPSA